MINKILFQLNKHVPRLYKHISKFIQWNDGYIEDEANVKDWLAVEDELVGGEFEAKEYQVGGQWEYYCYDFEMQKQNGLETMSCANQATINAVQILENRKWGKKPQNSKRFLAWASKTTRRGNSPTKVMEALRTQGTCSENGWSFGKIKRWAEYYIYPGLKVIGWAKEFVQRYIFNYEHIWYITAKNLMHFLKFSPIPIAVNAWHLGSDGLYYKVGKNNHYVVLIGYVYGEYWLVLDSYAPFIKKLRWNYGFSSAKRIHLRHRDEKFNTEELKERKDKGKDYIMNVDDRGKMYKITDDYQLVHIEKDDLTKELQDKLKDKDIQENLIRYLAEVLKVLVPMNGEDFKKLIK